MVEVSIINAAKFKEAHNSIESTEGLILRGWLNQPRYHYEAGFEDAGHKFSAIDTRIMGESQRVNHVVIMYRRLGLNYVERINLKTFDKIERRDKLRNLYARLLQWVMNEEIKPDSDIVIYRTHKQRRNMTRKWDNVKFPIRFVDDTYAILTGITNWYMRLNDLLMRIAPNGEPEHPSVNDVVEFNTFITDVLHTEDPFIINHSVFRDRCWYLWVWLRAYKSNICDIMANDGMSNEVMMRGELVLWKKGKCILRAENYLNSERPADRLVGLEPDNLSEYFDDMPDEVLKDQPWIKDGRF